MDMPLATVSATSAMRPTGWTLWALLAGYLGVAAVMAALAVADVSDGLITGSSYATGALFVPAAVALAWGRWKKRPVRMDVAMAVAAVVVVTNWAPMILQANDARQLERELVGATPEELMRRIEQSQTETARRMAPVVAMLRQQRAASEPILLALTDPALEAEMTPSLLADPVWRARTLGVVRTKRSLAASTMDRLDVEAAPLVAHLRRLHASSEELERNLGAGGLRGLQTQRGLSLAYVQATEARLVALENILIWLEMPANRPVLQSNRLLLPTTEAVAEFERRAQAVDQASARLLAAATAIDARESQRFGGGRGR